MKIAAVALDETTNFLTILALTIEGPGRALLRAANPSYFLYKRSYVIMPLLHVYL